MHGCVQNPTLFGIFFSLLFQHIFGTAKEVSMQTVQPFLFESKDESKSSVGLKRDMLFAEDDSVAAHSLSQL